MAYCSNREYYSKSKKSSQRNSSYQRPSQMSRSYDGKENRLTSNPHSNDLNQNSDESVKRPRREGTYDCSNIQESDFSSSGKRNSEKKKRAKQLYARNFHDSTSENVIKHFFAKFGAIEKLFMLRDKITNKFTGTVFVHFEDAASVSAVLNAKSDQLTLCLRKIYVDRVRSKDDDDEESSQVVQDVPDVVQDAPVFMLNQDVWMYILSFLSLRECTQIQSESRNGSKTIKTFICRAWRQLSIDHWRSKKQFSILEMGLLSDYKDVNVEFLFNRGCPAMKEISLEALRPSLGLTNKTMRCIANNCPNLQKLDVSNLSITNCGLQAVVERCKHLQSLRIRNESITEAGLRNMLPAATELTELTMCSSRRFVGMSLKQIGKQLTTIRFLNCPQLSDQAFKHLRDNCPDMKKISVASCPDLTNKSFATIATFTSLEELDVSGNFESVTSEGLMEISKCQNLVNLVLKRNDAVDDDILIAISKNCPKLELLCVSQGLGSDAEITDKSIISVAENCPLLCDINVNRCSLITDESLVALARNGKLKHLSVKLTSVGEKGLMTVVTDCPQIQFVDVFGCDGVTYSVVRKLRDLFSKSTTRGKCLVTVGGSHSWTDVTDEDVKCDGGLSIELEDGDSEMDYDSDESVYNYSDFEDEDDYDPYSFQRYMGYDFGDSDDDCCGDDDDDNMGFNSVNEMLACMVAFSFNKMNSS